MKYKNEQAQFYPDAVCISRQTFQQSSSPKCEKAAIFGGYIRPLAAEGFTINIMLPWLLVT